MKKVLISVITLLISTTAFAGNNDIYITYGPHVSLLDWLLGCLLIGCLLFRSYVISVLEYFVGRSKAHAVNILLRTPSTYWFCT